MSQAKLTAELRMITEPMVQLEAAAQAAQAEEARQEVAQALVGRRSTLPSEAASVIASATTRKGTRQLTSKGSAF